MTYDHSDPSTWVSRPPCCLDRMVGACVDTWYAMLIWMVRA